MTERSPLPLADGFTFAYEDGPYVDYEREVSRLRMEFITHVTDKDTWYGQVRTYRPDDSLLAEDSSANEQSTYEQVLAWLSTALKETA